MFNTLIKVKQKRNFMVCESETTVIRNCLQKLNNYCKELLFPSSYNARLLMNNSFKTRRLSFILLVWLVQGLTYASIEASPICITFISFLEMQRLIQNRQYNVVEKHLTENTRCILQSIRIEIHLFLYKLEKTKIDRQINKYF